MRKKTNLIFLIILALYLLASLYRLQDIPPPAFDEIAQLNIAEHIASEGRIRCDFYAPKFGEGKIFNSLPLQWLLLSGYIRIFGLDFFGVRFFYIILSLITLCGTYLLARRMFGERTAFFSLLVLASTHLFFSNSRHIIYHVPAATFSVVAILFFYIGREKGRKLFFIASGFLAGLACLTHPIGLGTMFIITVLLVFNKVSARFFLFYLGGAFIALLPYIWLVLGNFEEYLRQTAFVLKDCYKVQPVFLNILDEIPVRHFGLPPIRDAFAGYDAGNRYLYTLKWMMTNLDLKVYFCEVAGKGLFLLSLVYLGLKKLKTKSQKDLLLVTAAYVIYLAFFPNKFGPYIYAISPYFAICFAVFINDLPGITSQKRLNLKRLIGILLVAVFFISNLLLIYKDVSTKRVRGYFTFVKEIMRRIPKGSHVAGPAYFWLGMHKDYKFVSANEIVYEIDEIMKKEKGGIKFGELSSEEKDDIIKTLLAKYKLQYALITSHTWDEVTEAPGLAENAGTPIRRYLFYNARKEVDFLRINYYKSLPQPKDHEGELYYPPDGFYNVSAEYQDSLKIYRID